MRSILAALALSAAVPLVLLGAQQTAPAAPAPAPAQQPSFRAGVRLPAFDNVDVYPLLARLLRITPAANDGDIAPLLPALQDAR